MTARNAILNTTTVCVALLTLALAGCDDAPAPEREPSIVTTDPLIARALADPLMVDPDLAYRNEANAAVRVRYDHPLPPLFATDDQADRARDAAWVELLEDGPIDDLPPATRGARSADLANVKDAAGMVRAVGGPLDCAAKLEAGLAWAAKMPMTASIMPHGMVQQAAGTEGSGCTLRVVRYLTSAGIEDALQYHFTRADRARLRPEYYEAPEHAIIGAGRTEQLVIHARPGLGGMSAVDLIYWTK